MLTLEDAARELHEDLTAAGIPVVGVAFLRPADPRQPGWHVVERSDGFGVRIDYDPSATSQQITNGDALALAFNLGRERKTRGEVRQDIAALDAAQRAFLLNTIAAEFLLDRPVLARILGIALFKSV